MSKQIEFDMELAKQVCKAIAESPKGLKHILKSNQAFPSRSVFYLWLRSSEELKDSYARAKELQAELLFEECLDIADDSGNDVKVTEHGDVCNTEFVQRSRVRIDTRKWMLGKLRPEKYGDRITQEHVGPNGGPVQTVNVDMTPEQAAEVYKQGLG